MKTKYIHTACILWNWSLSFPCFLQAVAYNKNIPYPRTCGATFCTDRLVTFQRPVHSAVQYTPRSLNEKPSTHTTYSSKTRSNFYGPSISRSPKDSVFSTYYKRHRAKKKEKSGPICVYNVASLLPVNKHLAAQYKITPSEASCSHNAEVKLVICIYNVYIIFIYKSLAISYVL